MYKSDIEYSVDKANILDAYGFTWGYCGLDDETRTFIFQTRKDAESAAAILSNYISIGFVNEGE